MAFPTTPLLDTFNRANENPVSGGGNWLSPLKNGQNFLQLVSNTVTTQAIEQRCSSYWSASFTADQEVYCDIPDFESLLSLHIRQSSPDTISRDGYSIELSGLTGPGNIAFFRSDSASDTSIGSTISASFTVGDGIGLSIVGSTLSVYQRAGASGTWLLLGTATDSTHASGNFIGVEGFSFSLNPLLDNFGGGIVASTGIKTAVVYDVAPTASGTQTLTSSGFGSVRGAIGVLSGSEVDGTPANHANISFGLTDMVNQNVIAVRDRNGVATTNTKDWAASDAFLLKINDSSTAVQAKARVVRSVTDGIEIEWIVPPVSAHKLMVILLGGEDLSIAVGTVDAGSVENATHTVSGLSFEPDVLAINSRFTKDFTDSSSAGSDLAIGFARNNKASGTVTQVSHNYHGHDGASVGDPRARTQTDRIIRYAVGNTAFDVGLEILSFQSDGWSGAVRDDNGDSVFYGYMALAFGGAVNSWVGIVDLAEATGTVTHSEPAMKPQLVVHALNQTNGTAFKNGAGAGAFGISAVSASQSACITYANEDGSATGDTESLANAKPIHLDDDDGTVGIEADFVSFQSTGPQYSYITVKTGPKQIPTLVIEEFVAPTPPASDGGTHSKLSISFSIGL